MPSIKSHKVINFVPAGFRVKKDGKETAYISRNKEWLGHLLELATELSLKELKEDFISPAIRGKGPDHVSEHTLIEDKNWAPYFRNPSLFEKEVISRFLDTDPDHKKLWVLVISKLDPTSDLVRKMIKQNEIHVIELGYQLTSNSKGIIKKAVKILKIKLRVIFSDRKRSKERSDYLNKLTKIYPLTFDPSYNHSKYPDSPSKFCEDPSPDHSDLSENWF